MNMRRVVWVGLGVLALSMAIFTGWLLSLPGAASVSTAPPVPDVERKSMLAALQPAGRHRPVIAVVGLNEATETTDYLMSYGILKRADVADVFALATQPGPITLYPALKVEPEATVAQFDARYPKGADYVIVPAMSRDDDAQVLRWINDQAAKGAWIISVCAGAKVVAAAGLLDGKSATTHWYYIGDLLEKHPAIHYVSDRRMVLDRGVATTTGITASMPMMLTLIEAIGGRAKADAIARDLGVTQWDARHNSDAFTFTRPFALTALRNRLAFWRRDDLGIKLRAGIDEVSLALVADAWSRTYRSSAFTYAAGPQPVETLHGMRLVPDRVAVDWPAAQQVSDAEGTTPAEALDQTLARIAGRYGDATADLVAMQLEYPRVGYQP
ncbi:DJ-1/PfpI family protein [Allopusillimonas ginsengisoli]|uniref:DJ-1/PfpI family protein n=1 Tax=Allopusillimonas ginsengisoli TaxID=453575 RepID=UPI00101ED4E9|nr:DJ-1/PfpI family protein [Allopusillimonas ginsengisoli]TEA79174.1 transcriptional regulator [Allopusillimonas ginsengisoli]